jgi:hypothetical protein
MRATTIKRSAFIHDDRTDAPDVAERAVEAPRGLGA